MNGAAVAARGAIKIMTFARTRAARSANVRRWGWPAIRGVAGLNGPIIRAGLLGLKASSAALSAMRLVLASAACRMKVTSGEAAIVSIAESGTRARMALYSADGK